MEFLTSENEKLKEKVFKILDLASELKRSWGISISKLTYNHE